MAFSIQFKMVNLKHSKLEMVFQYYSEFLDYSKPLYHKCLLLKNLSSMGFFTPLDIFPSGMSEASMMHTKSLCVLLATVKVKGRRQMFVH
jgi:hypothetical protein